MHRSSNGQSHAKIILMGDHSVVYGEPAIAMPISEIKCQVTMTETLDGNKTIDSRYFSGLISDLPEEMDGILTILERLINDFGGTSDSWKMKITSMLPAERGMGSSAATAIAIIRCFYSYYGDEISKNDLLELVELEERVTHNNPSGLDAATASSNYPVWFVRNQTIENFKMQMDAVLVIADSGIKGKTKEAIQIVKNQWDEQHDITQKRIQELGWLTKNAAEFLKKNQVEALGDAFNQAQTILSDLNLSHPEIDKLINVANNKGAFGAKFTGGGRGGCIIALVNNQMKAKFISTALIDAGATATWIQPLNEIGVNNG